MAIWSFGSPYVLYVSYLFVVLVSYYFGFEGGTLVLIALVSDHCLPFTVRFKYILGCLIFLIVLLTLQTFPLWFRARDFGSYCISISDHCYITFRLIIASVSDHRYITF